jgi:hypothetical protein
MTDFDIYNMLYDVSTEMKRCGLSPLTIKVVGGFAVHLCFDSSYTTSDIDAYYDNSQTFTDIVERVGREYGLKNIHWLNNQAEIAQDIPDDLKIPDSHFKRYPHQHYDNIVIEVPSDVRDLIMVYMCSDKEKRPLDTQKAIRLMKKQEISFDMMVEYIGPELMEKYKTNIEIVKKTLNGE